jgi:hypothetical protein
VDWLLAGTARTLNFLIGGDGAPGTTPEKVYVWVDVYSDSLSVGTHTVNLSFTSPSATNPSFTIPVTVNVAEPDPPSLFVRPQQLRLLTVPNGRGSDPESVEVVIKNYLDGLTLPVSFSTTTPWMTLSQKSCTTPCGFSAYGNPAGLAPGTYTGEVIIKGPSPEWSSVVLVELSVSEDNRPSITEAVDAASSRPVVSPGS